MVALLGHVSLSADRHLGCQPTCAAQVVSTDPGGRLVFTIFLPLCRSGSGSRLVLCDQSVSFERAPDGLALQFGSSPRTFRRARDVIEFLADFLVETSTTHAILRLGCQAVKLDRGQAAQLVTRRLFVGTLPGAQGARAQRGAPRADRGFDDGSGPCVGSAPRLLRLRTPLARFRPTSTRSAREMCWGVCGSFQGVLLVDQERQVRRVVDEVEVLALRDHLLVAGEVDEWRVVEAAERRRVPEGHELHAHDAWSIAGATR